MKKVISGFLCIVAVSVILGLAAMKTYTSYRKVVDAADSVTERVTEIREEVTELYQFVEQYIS